MRLGTPTYCYRSAATRCPADLRACGLQPPDAIQAALGIDRAQLLALDATLATGNIYQNATSLCHQEVKRSNIEHIVKRCPVPVHVSCGAGREFLDSIRVFRVQAQHSTMQPFVVLVNEHSRRPRVVAVQNRHRHDIVSGDANHGRRNKEHLGCEPCQWPLWPPPQPARDLRALAALHARYQTQYPATAGTFFQHTACAHVCRCIVEYDVSGDDASAVMYSLADTHLLLHPGTSFWP